MLPTPKDRVAMQECVGEQVTNKKVEIWDKSPMNDRLGRTQSFSGVSQKRRVWILAYCQTIPPPPPKGECLQCASVTLLRAEGRWRGDIEGERGQNGDEVHGADAIFVVGFGKKY